LRGVSQRCPEKIEPGETNIRRRVALCTWVYHALSFIRISNEIIISNTEKKSKVEFLLWMFSKKVEI